MTPSPLHALIPLTAVLVACAQATSSPAPAPTTTVAAPVAAIGEWTDLLDGPATHWRGYQMQGFPDGWTFDRQTRVLQRSRGGGDLITRRQFTNFELALEWKVGPRGNSGVFFRATEGTPRIYENAPEVQILDNMGHPDGGNSLTSAGANYALHAPSRDVTRPVDEWNSMRLIVRGAHVEQWLNGIRVVSYDLWTDDWKRKVGASKFAQWPSYGLATSGHIGLQDHGDVVEFRNIRIQELAR